MKSNVLVPRIPSSLHSLVETLLPRNLLPHMRASIARNILASPPKEEQSRGNSRLLRTKEADPNTTLHLQLLALLIVPAKQRTNSKVVTSDDIVVRS